MLIWSLGIPYFQLPLSGSQEGVPTTEKIISILELSTPSLGITSLEEAERTLGALKTFNSLSRDHLREDDAPRNLEADFQLPLSGSPGGSWTAG